MDESEAFSKKGVQAKGIANDLWILKRGSGTNHCAKALKNSEAISVAPSAPFIADSSWSDALPCHAMVSPPAQWFDRHHRRGVGRRVCAW